jgi:DNA replication protein DnaC
MLDLAACRWVDAHQNVIFSGKTGVGKSYLACALGQKACREGYSVVYRRASRLYDELAQARAGVDPVPWSLSGLWVQAATRCLLS